MPPWTHVGGLILDLPFFPASRAILHIVSLRVLLSPQKEINCANLFLERYVYSYRDT
jgi:hypothetical protein